VKKEEGVERKAISAILLPVVQFNGGCLYAGFAGEL
jgi:hypothetical protein